MRLIAFFLCLAAAPALAGPADDLGGDWTVDLRPAPTAPAHLKPMRLAVAADGAVTGTFYDNAIAGGRAGAGNGRTCFAFRTADQSGPYQTSGCLVGDTIQGQTWSEGRGFFMTWTAKRP